ncbi:ATPase family AAA domain-containing protein 5 isoform X2 [Planococcus citri]|uniref:ATPase family AAA domain-containing protein 5 isoform X2 n=1 Tax=Planococcus citri TaxID=170843 RepID=UPI0031FA377A
MKDLTHYFQTPKAKSSSSEATESKTPAKCKRKASDSVDSESTKTLVNGNETTPEEEIFTTKKRRKSNPSSRKKPTKPTANGTHENNLSDDENTPILKRTVKCNGDATDKIDSTPVKKVRTYSKKKPVNVVESKNADSFDGMNFDVHVLLSDCVRENSSVAETNESSETTASNSDSCFVDENKSKNSSKSNNDDDSLETNSSAAKSNRSLKTKASNSDSCLVNGKKPKKSSKLKKDDDSLKVKSSAAKLNRSLKTKASNSDSCSVDEEETKKSSKSKNDDDSLNANSSAAKSNRSLKTKASNSDSYSVDEEETKKSSKSKNADDNLNANSSAAKSNQSLETEASSSDSCFVDEKKPKKSSKLKKDKKESLETEPSDLDSSKLAEKKPKQSSKSKNDKDDESKKNNLLNYFSKVDKLPSIPDKTHVSPTLMKKSKKKSCNFDDITVIEEVIKDDDKSSKLSTVVPTTPQPQIENVSPEGTVSKGKSWKMRVKLTPSANLEGVISRNNSRKYRKIIVSSSDDEDTENKIETQSDHSDVEFVSESKKEPDPMMSANKETPQPIKLAPLFTKRNDIKSTPNRIRISDEAKRQFLESGVPDVIKKKMEELKNNAEDEYKGEYVFPKCTHVQQKEPESFIWDLKEYTDFKLRDPMDDIQIDEILHQSYCSLITNDVKPESDQGKEETFQFDLKNEINSLKKQEPNANVMDIHSSIKRLKKVSESVPDICWTEKYKPFVFGDMIGNTNSLHQLKEWIESHKRMKQVFLESDSSSGGEFVDSDDSCSSTDVKNNVAIIVGPPGCGKTCAVFMLANELGFKVLEVNAGSNRAGKKIIDELLEATQSHRVKRTSGSLFNSKPEKSKKKKKKEKESKKDRKTMSLILIEDADILFENHDEGFLSALNSLTSLSKRPLIFTVNNLNYPHLHKYNNAQNLILRFNYPSRASINAWLKVIALLEGVQLSDELLIELYKIAGSDLRKNLLQLQMLVQSKYLYPKSNNEQLFYQDWLSNVRCLGDKKITPKLNDCNGENDHDKLFSDDEETCSLDDLEKKEEIVVAPKPKSELRRDREALLESVKLLNYAANLDDFACDNDQKIFPSRFSPAKDANDFTYRLNSDLVEFIKNRIFDKYEKNASFSFKKYFNAVSQNSRIKTITENVFVSFNPRICNQRVRNCDYLPTIRDIARFEKTKTPTTLRRSNRYFSYLKSVSIDVTDKEIEILCNTFVS